jgi:hypothetical protein
MKIGFLASILAIVGFAGSANALTIDCADAGCIGGTYTLDIISTGLDTYAATYTIDTSGVFDVAATTLNDVEFKVSNDYSDIFLSSGPSGSVVGGPLSGNGCNGNNDTFICVDLTPDLSIGGVYVWDITFSSTALIDESDWHVGARYTAPDHQSGWVISESSGAAPVPEPTAALLFGAGLLATGIGFRNRKS